MSDLFERSQQHNFFLPETPEQYKPNVPAISQQENSTAPLKSQEEIRQSWNEKLEQRIEFQERMRSGPGAGLSLREYGTLYDWLEQGIIEDDDLYKMVSARELASYFGKVANKKIDPLYVFDNYDAIWQAISNDRQDRYAMPKSRWQAITDSIQIAKNMEPMGRMGLELQFIHQKLITANAAERETLQRQADDLWKEITALREANSELGRGMPTDALTTIATSTIQSALFTGKSILGGIAGAAIAGGIGAIAGGPAGAVGGLKIGYTLGSFSASSTEMAGLLYIDLLAAGVKQQNAAGLAIIGGGLQGFIESGLGVVAGWGSTAVRAIGGRALSQEAQKKIADTVSKNFIKKIMTTPVGSNALTKGLLSTASQTLSEGFEEGLQFLVEQTMLALGDAMQDAPVERDSWGSPEFWNEMQNAVIGGLAGGLGFGIVGLPLNITGNIQQTAKQTQDLKNLALTIDNEPEFMAAARQNPLTKNLSDEQIREMYKSQESERRAYRSEESRIAAELSDRRLYSAMDQSGNVYRGKENILYMEHSRHTESNGLTIGEFAVGDPRKSEKNSYAIGNYELRGDTVAITEFRIGQKYEGLQNEILQNFANDVGKKIEYSGQRYAPNGAGTSLRFGWGKQTRDNIAPNTRQARGFYSDGQPYSAADTQADTTAKQNFTNQLKALNTQLSGDAQINTVVDFYDTVGRKWFGMSFDSFMNRMTGGSQQWLHQMNLSDEQTARFIATKQGVLTDAAAVQQIQKNLTNAQREEARASIHGFAVTGADGVTKAIHAAQDADVSTFIHEGVHAFTKLAEAIDPALFRQMMEAAGLDMDEYNRADDAGKEQMMRQAMEKLAYGAEAYLKEGPKSVQNSALKNLYDKIKEFLKDLADAVEKGKFLTPEVRSLFDGLFGEETNAAASENVKKSTESVTKTEENVNKNTESVSESEEYEIYSEKLKRDIKDKSLPDEVRCEAAVKNAELEMLDEQDRAHGPTAELIKRARRIADPARQKKVIKEIRELRKQYAGTKAEYKAPNGKESLLLKSLGEDKGREAWYAVRLENFKKWFGDWELAARIEAIEALDAQKIKPGESLTKKEAETQLISDKKLINKNDKRIAQIPVNTIGKILDHKGYNTSKIVKDIPALYETSIFGWTESERDIEGHKPHRNIKAYHNYINKFSDGSNEYFIRFTLNEERTKPGKTGKNNIHSTAISDISIYKKTMAPVVSGIIDPGVKNSSSFIDNKLIQFFNSVKPDSVSKAIDENGEPLRVLHGTGTTIDEFKIEYTGKGYDQLGSGFYFTSDTEEAKGYTTRRNSNNDIKLGGEDNPNVIELFLNIKNPIILNKEQDDLRENPITVKQAAAIIEIAPNIYDAEKSPLIDWVDNGGKRFTKKDIHKAAENYDNLLSLENDFFKGNATAFRHAVHSVMNYDGVIKEHKNGEKHFVAWFPNQIKSSTGNVGTFDSLQDNIYFQTAFHGSPFIDDLNRSNYFQHGWGRTFYSQKEAAKWAQNAISKTKGVEGQLYNTSIPDDTNLLHWDKTISEQPEVVRKVADSLITWNKNGKSELNPAYNLRKFHDGNYGFFRSIDGKMKWETIEEAQSAAKEDIKKTLTGKALYNSLAERIGKKETSLLLDHLGVKGTKYYDKNTEKIGLKSGYNYVIYGDSEIEITQTYYSEAFRDAGLSEFMVNYPDIVKEAAQFKNGAEMAEYYADYFAMPDEVFRKAKALGYFDAITRAAKEGNAENATNAVSGISADKAAAALAAYGIDIATVLEAAILVRKDDWQASVRLLEKHGAPRIDAEVYADTAKLFTKSEMSWLERMAADEKVIIEDAYQKNKWKPEDGTFYVDAENKEPIKIGKENPAITRFFNTLVDGAREIYTDKENEELRAELAGEERTAKSFVDMINTEKGFDEFIGAAYRARQERQQGETEEETKQNEAIFDRAITVFNTNNGNWKAAFENLASGKKVNEHTKRIIRGMIRNRPLQYMETWAMMTGDDTWLPEENDIKRIKRLDTEGLVDEEYLERQSPEELERIGRRLSSDRIKKKIDNKTLLLDDPEFNEYERQLKEDMAKARKLIAEREKGFMEYKEMLDLARSNARKQQILLEQEALDTSNEGLKASREKITGNIIKRKKGIIQAHQEVRKTIDDMERFMREKLFPSQKEAFMELRNQLRESERIHAELKAIAEIREIKKRNLRQILRKPDLKTVSLREAKYIEWIQSHFDSYEAVARFIGRGAKDIRQLYNEFATNAEYRDTLKKHLPQGAYKRIEKIIYEDAAAQKVRAYGKINAHDRRVLYRHLLNHQAIFEEMGIDITEELRKFSDDEYNKIREEMKDLIPADVLYKLEGLLVSDKTADKNEYAGRRFKVENFTIEDLQTLAGVVSNLRKEGREREAARKDARSVLRQEGREKILKTIEEHMPKGAIGYRMKGTASTKLEEEKRSGLKGVWYALHNARRFFRSLEGGKDGYLYNFITQREYAAFDQENENVFRRREEVEKKLKDAKIDLKDLGRIRFITFDGKEKTLDEMLTFYYAQFNERAFHAVVFGNFASQNERNAIKALADNWDLIGQMHAEAKIAERYHEDMKKLDEFFAKDGNEKYKLIMTIIGEDYDGNYERLKEFVAREYNEELGSEQYYMPLMREGVVAKESDDFEQAMADTGMSRFINRGMTKGRVDIPSFGQQAIQAGFYAMWDRMIVKQEHLMAYDPLHKEMRQIFQGNDSETLRDTIRSGHSQAAIDFIEKFISELAAPPVQDNFAALDKVSRMLQGHYPAAVLGGRIASIVKQAIESPPPFFQYMFPWEYAAASASCLKQETRDMIREKSVYMKARYFDPAAAVVKEMEKMYLAGKMGKAEAVLSKVESGLMKGQEWIDTVCVMPGWLAAYNKKFAELKNKNSNMTSEEIETEAVKYADQIVRDCQPSSVLMDQIQMLKGEKHPLARMFMLFQTPIASIFQQLFIDAPANFKQGRVLQALWTWGIYALLAIVIGAMQDDDDDEDDWNLKKRGIDALVMPISMIPIYGGDLSYAVEDLIRTGKIRLLRRSNFPVLDQGIRAINKFSDEEWGNAGWETLKGFMYLTGLPVAALNDVEKAIETERIQRVFGIR